MEILKEKENKEESNRSFGILLILNIIIWSIIILMAIFWGGVVNAQGYNMTNWNVRDANDNWYSYANGTTQDVSLINAIGFNFNGTTGNNNGVVYVEGDALGQVATNDISISWWTSPTNNGTGAVSKNCAISKTSTLLWHVKCQFNFTITNNSDNIAILMNLANARNFYSLTVSGYTDVQPNNNATTQDIINQTIQITNQIIESVRNSIQNVEDQSDNIIYQISNAIENAASTIINTSTYCETIDKGDIVTDNAYINVSNNNTITTFNKTGITDYIPINKNNEIRVIKTDTEWFAAGSCFYDGNKAIINCFYNKDLTLNQQITIPDNAKYIRFTIDKQNNKPNFEICKSDIQAMIDNQNSNTNRLIQELYNNNASQIEQLSAIYTAVTPDTQDFDDLEDIESDLHDYTNVNLNSFNVDLDTDTNNWVWTTLTTIINTNALVFGMIISILSVGLIKLILNR